MATGTRNKYARLKGRMYSEGFTIRSWALAERMSPSTVYDALRGKRHGVKAQAIRGRAKEVFGV